MDWCIKDVREGPADIGTLACADDVAVVTNGVKALRETEINRCYEAITWNAMNIIIEVGKTEFMHVSRGII